MKIFKKNYNAFKASVSIVVVLVMLCSIILPMAKFDTIMADSVNKICQFKPKDSSDVQKWKFEGNSFYVGGRTTWSDSDKTTEWTLEYVESGKSDTNTYTKGHYRIKNIKSGLYLTMTGESQSYNASFLPKDEENKCQIWSFIYYQGTGGAFYNIANTSVTYSQAGEYCYYLTLSTNGVCSVKYNISGLTTFVGDQDYRFSIREGTTNFVKIENVKSDIIKLYLYQSGNYMLKAESKDYFIINNKNGKYLTLNDDKTLTTEGYSKDLNQVWKISEGYSGYLSISNVKTAEIMSVNMSSSDNNIIWSNNVDALTGIALNGDKSFKLPASETFYTLDFNSDYNEVGLPLVLSDYCEESDYTNVEFAANDSSADAQKWYFELSSGEVAATNQWAIIKDYKWKFVTVLDGDMEMWQIIESKSGLALAEINGEIVLVKADKESDKQLWFFNKITCAQGKAYNIVNKATNENLAISENNKIYTDNLSGALSAQWQHVFVVGESFGYNLSDGLVSCLQARTGAWGLYSLSSANYLIKNAQSGNYLTVRTGVLYTGEYIGEAPQLWKIIEGFNGYRAIKSVANGKILSFDENEGKHTYKWTDLPNSLNTAVAFDADKTIKSAVSGISYTVALHPDLVLDGQNLSLSEPISGLNELGGYNADFESFDERNPVQNWKFEAQTAKLYVTDNWNTILKNKWKMQLNKSDGKDYYSFIDCSNGLALTNDSGVLNEKEYCKDDNQLWSLPSHTVEFMGENPNYNIISKADGKYIAVYENNSLALESVAPDAPYRIQHQFVFGSKYGTEPSDELITTLQARGGSYGICSDISKSSFRIINRNNDGYLTCKNGIVYTCSKKYIDGTQMFNIVASKASGCNDYICLYNVSECKCIGFDESDENKIDVAFSESDKAAALKLTSNNNSYTLPEYGIYYQISAHSYYNLDSKLFALGNKSTPNEMLSTSPVFIQDYASGINQKWMLEKIEDNYYKVKNLSSGLFLAEMNGNVVLTSAKDNDDSQIWFIETEYIPNFTEKNYTNLRNKFSNKALSCNSKGEIYLSSPSTSFFYGIDNLWSFDGYVSESDGLITHIIGRNDGKFSLSTTEKETPVLVIKDKEKYSLISASSLPHNSIKWEFSPVQYLGETVYTIKNVNNGFYLANDPASGGALRLSEYSEGNENQYYRVNLVEKDSLKYKIQSVGFFNSAIVWSDNNGVPYGTILRSGDSTGDYFWSFNGGETQFDHIGGTYTLLSQGGYLRATGDDEDYGNIPVDKTVYYISNDGNDANNGQSQATAIKTIKRMNEIIAESGLTAGNKILFRKGDTFVGELKFSNSFGTKDNPIYIGSYGTGSKRPLLKAPTITKGTLSEDNRKMVEDLIKKSGIEAKDFSEIIEEPESTKTFSALCVTDSWNITIENLDFYGENDGEKWFSQYRKSNAIVWIRNCLGVTLKNSVIKGNVNKRIKNTLADQAGTVYYDKWHDIVQLPYLGNDYYALSCTNSFDPANTDYSNMIIENVEATKVTGFSVDGSFYTLKNCKIYDSPSWGFIATGNDAKVINCSCTNTGYGQNTAGNAAFMTVRSSNIEFEGIRAENIKRGPQNFDGVGFDFEGSTDKITIRNSTFKNIEGPAIMIFNSGINSNFIIDAVNIEDYCLVGATGYEAGINFAAPPGAYANSGTIINTVIIKNSDAPFYTGYSNPGMELVEYKGVNFINCSFLTEKTDLSKLKALLKMAKSIKLSNGSEYAYSLLKNAIDSAQIVAKNEYAVPNVVNEAYNALSRAIKAFMNTIPAKTDNNKSADIIVNENSGANETDYSLETIDVSDSDKTEDFTYDDFVSMLEQAISDNKKQVVIEGRTLPVITSEMLEKLKSAQMGIILQLLDENDEIFARFQIDEVIYTDKCLDVGLLNDIEEYLLPSDLENDNYQVVSFKNKNIRLPGKMNIIIRNKGNFKFGDKLVFLFYDQTNKKYEALGNALISNDGNYISLSVDNSGDYLIKKDTLNKNKTALKNDKNTLPLYVVALIILAFLIISFLCIIIVLRLKKKGKK